MQNSKIEIPLLRWGLPLSYQSNFLVILALIPCLLIVYLFREYTFMQEGGTVIFVILAVIDAFVVRFFLTKKEHPEVPPIIYENQIFTFPSNLFPDKQSKKLNLKEVQEVLIYESASVRGRAIWRLVLKTGSGEIILKNFWTDLNNILEIIEENGIKITKKIIPIFLWFYGIMFVVGIGLLIWGLYFRY